MSPFLLTRTLPEDATEAALRADVLHGLTRTPRALPPKWFYDALGSELVDNITELPEYYPTRALWGSFILSVVRAAWPTLVPKPEQRSWTDGGRAQPALSSHRPLRATTDKGVGIGGAAPVDTYSAFSGAWRVTVVASVALSASELRTRHSADVASTEERHS